MKGTRQSRRRAKAEATATTTLIRGGTLLTLDDNDRTGRFDLLLAGDRIEQIGPHLSRRGVGRVVDAEGLLVMPGLVQAHTRLYQTLFRGVGDGDEAQTWLEERILPREAALHAADVRAAARLAFAELLLGGTTAVLDMHGVRYAEILFEEAERCGIRYHGGKAILDLARGLPAALRETADQALAASQACCDRWHGQAGGRLRYAFALHSPLWCSEAAVRGALAAARRAGASVQMAIAQTSDEAELCRERTGKSPVAYLAELGALGPHLVLSHGVWLTASERALLKESGTHLVHCPANDLKLGAGLARLPELANDGLSLSLGCASAAANDTLDGFAELRLAALVHRHRHGPRAVPPAQILRLATRGGAMALGLDQVGALREGWRADLVLLDLRQPHLWPPTLELASRVVHTARASDVRSVWVAGELVVEERRPCHLELDRVLAKASEHAAAVEARSQPPRESMAR